MELETTRIASSVVATLASSFLTMFSSTSSGLAPFQSMTMRTSG